MVSYWVDMAGGWWFVLHVEGGFADDEGEAKGKKVFV